MKRITLSLILFFCTVCLAADASTLYRVRFAYYPEKIRAVFDFDGGFTYQTDESKEKIIIFLKKIEAGPEIPNYVELNDLIVKYFKIEKMDEDLKVTIPLGESIEYNIFYLNDPPRLVVDFGREYLNIVSGGTLAEGIEHLKVRKGSAAGRITASVLKIDLDKAEVEPALARRLKPGLVESFIDFLTPWRRKKAWEEHFTLDKVSNIVAENGALAGVNGTYFAFTGSPLGALMIDQELISIPIHGRTAFFLDDKNSPYIDNIYVTSYFKLESGIRYKITGVNQGRGSNDLIMYTPVWGKYTGTNQEGIELVVVNSRITEINLSNSKIPEDGYVLSASGPGVETLAESVKAGTRINTRIRIIPYSTSPRKIIHLVSGGPRLLKNGRIYVSKHAEKFKMDIARGRAARTAIGFTKDKKLLLVTVDGPPRKKRARAKLRSSIGATLEELSKLMLALGASEAMNLDGGSSSTMVIEDKVVNRPTSGYERKVNNAIVVRPKN
ncbi:MAG: phosphodiester glycosidase family protein [Candidatus Margulisiibacteriota bacterium]